MTLSIHPSTLKSTLATLPTQPGIYRMYSATGELLYVGKAKNLKNRVRSYFPANILQLTPKTRIMIRQVTQLDYVLTDSEVEALILEANLVKKHQPKYNILLKDDKKFPWLCLTDEPFPRLIVTRTPLRKGKAKSFGPYTNSGDMHTSLHVIRKHFPLRQRRKPLFRERPCMNYYIGACLGPCQKLVSPEDYQQVLHQVELFLNGKGDELLELLRHEMAHASEILNFEWAAKLRDRYQAVEAMLERRQKVVSDDISLSQDIVALAADELRCALTVMNIRRGKLIGSRSHELPLLYETTPEEAYSSFLYQYYQHVADEDLPEELLLQYPIEDEELLSDWLSARRQKYEKSKKKLQLTYPRLGAKKKLLELGVKNAAEALEQYKRADFEKLQGDATAALMALQEALDLSDFPTRMECYDISHVQGTNTVASMVVFTDGRPNKAEYRRFKIQSTEEGKPDDFRSMNEVIRRRFEHSGEKVKGKDAWEDPDLVIIDGGKGQLNAAIAALQAQGVIDQPIISLAKKFEEVYLPGRERPVRLPRDSAALFLLQQIRDEAHRFAITYHRNLRQKAAKRSALDDLKGIGEKRKQQLLKHFGSVEKIKKASTEELGKALGTPGNGKLVQKLYEVIHASAS